jgi:glycosyltransferase involved in cell wall biosynthesis
MSELPLVSILALCYNHSEYLNEALESIQNLKYKNIEVWIIDDASPDNSAELLREWQKKRTDWNFVFNETNKGNCRTFNSVLSKCSGKWVIDFATDDVLDDSALENWVKRAETDPSCGFCYADGTILFQESGKKIRFSETIARKEFPEGKILPELLHHPFICPPAVMFRRDVLVELGGYDETLSYEDWDIWLRISQKYLVMHHGETVITYRRHSESLSSSLLFKRNRHILQSTVQILERISNWPDFASNPTYLASFVRYHLRLSFALQLPSEAKSFYSLLQKIKCNSLLDYILFRLSGSLPMVYPMYKAIQKIRKH